MTHDLIVIGAGPAGLSAAAAAARLGLKTALIDEQARPGGQIYRNVTAVLREVGAILGPDYLHGRAVAEAIAGVDLDLRFGTTVWDIAPDLTITALQNDRSIEFRAPQLIVATGAMERASPVPGWTLPGVLNAGAAQIALKSGGSIPAGNIVLAGGGPLLLLVACQLLDAGASIAGIVETSPSQNRLRALPFLPQAMLVPKLLAKGLKMMARIRRAGIPWFTGAHHLSVEGSDHAEALAFTVGTRQHCLMADAVLLHHGVIPNTQISRLLRVDHGWSDAQLAWFPRLDAFGETSLSGFRVAGDGGGIAGALAAEASGQLAAIGAAHALGKISSADRDRLAGAPRKNLKTQQRIRPFLDALYRPPQWITAPSEDTIVCRCEEVTAGEIRATVKLGVLGPNQTKFFNRCGMGPCQGRVCGVPVTGILASETGTDPSIVGAYRVRAPLKPVPLGAIAQLKSSQITEVVK